MTESTIRSMKLHAVESIGKGIDIVRVVGGYIYILYYNNTLTSTFVPFDKQHLDSDLL